jgi:putative membrane protein
MFILLLISYREQLGKYLSWSIPVFLLGFAVEWVGVHKGWLFGEYRYTPVLGYAIAAVPVLIGANWVVVMTGSISLAKKISGKKWLIAVLAACIATVYDWVLEPIAIKLGYWQWKNGVVPLYNYVCWWAVSFVMALFWVNFRIHPNKFGLTLFIIQLLFFVLLRMML